jgi:hypothetical protein
MVFFAQHVSAPLGGAAALSAPVGRRRLDFDARMRCLKSCLMGSRPHARTPHRGGREGEAPLPFGRGPKGEGR